MHSRDFVTRQQVYLERIKAGQVGRLDTVAATLRRKLSAILTAVDADDLGQLSKREVSQLIYQIKEVQVGLMLAEMDKLGGELQEVGGWVAGNEANALSTNVVPVARFASPTAELAYKRALAAPVEATGELLTPFMRSWVPGDAARVSNVIRTGWAQGSTIQGMTARIVGTRKNAYTDGAIITTRRNAATVARTATQHVANQSRQEVWEKNSKVVRAYQWISTLDRKTSQQCKSLDGRIFKPGQGPTPPIHPNCRSSTIAVLDKKFDFLDEGATRSAERGTTSASSSYYEWLKRQDFKFQTEALGKTRGILLRNGGLTVEEFSRLNLDRNFEPLTLSQMRKIDPAAFARAGL